MDEEKERIQDLLGRVRDILADTLTGNQEIKKIMGEIEDLGLKVNLNFIALIGGPSQWMGDEPIPLMLKNGLGFIPQMPGEVKFELNENDRDFLKSIGITFEDKGATRGEAGEPEGADE